MFAWLACCYRLCTDDVNKPGSLVEHHILENGESSWILKYFESNNVNFHLVYALRMFKDGSF